MIGYVNCKNLVFENLIKEKLDEDSFELYLILSISAVEQWGIEAILVRYFNVEIFLRHLKGGS